MPTPDWAAYAADPSAIPTECANGQASGNPSFGTQRPNVTVFEPDFGAPRSWRASLGMTHRLSARLGASIDASYALGTNLYSVRDLNLNTTPGFYYHYQKRESAFPVAVHLLKKLLADHPAVYRLIAPRANCRVPKELNPW